MLRLIHNIMKADCETKLKTPPQPNKKQNKGNCCFLQLTNSVVHVVQDGFMSAWGTLHLDHHNEEDYMLQKPLKLSENRMTQFTRTWADLSFDHEGKMKWKKIIFA
jgi:hypothetical protein